MAELLHRGRDCRHIHREGFSLADCRCRKAIERYEAPEYAFLNSSAWVPPAVAAKALEMSEAEVVRLAKGGQLPRRYPQSVSQRITLHGASGPRDVTLREAARRLKISLDELRKRIDSGDYEPFYPDEHLEIEIVVKWEHEKCPLWANAGVCAEFEQKGTKNEPRGD